MTSEIILRISAIWLKICASFLRGTAGERVVPLKIALNLCMFLPGTPCPYPGIMGIPRIFRAIPVTQVDGM